MAKTHEIEHAHAKGQRDPARRGGTEMTDFTEIRKAKALFAAAVLRFSRQCELAQTAFRA